MRHLYLPIILLTGCASAPLGSPAPDGPLVEIRESFTCPLPPSRGLITITRDGKAERVIFEGLEFELGKTKSSRETLALSATDAATLFNLVADSGWKSIPENPEYNPMYSCVDCCSGSLYVKTPSGGRSLRYGVSGKPAALEKLMRGIHGILARGTWTRVLYDWEKQR